MTACDLNRRAKILEMVQGMLSQEEESDILVHCGQCELCRKYLEEIYDFVLKLEAVGPDVCQGTSSSGYCKIILRKARLLINCNRSAEALAVISNNRKTLLTHGSINELALVMSDINKSGLTLDDGNAFSTKFNQTSLSILFHFIQKIADKVTLAQDWVAALTDVSGPSLCLNRMRSLEKILPNLDKTPIFELNSSGLNLQDIRCRPSNTCLSFHTDNIDLSAVAGLIFLLRKDDICRILELSATVPANQIENAVKSRLSDFSSGISLMEQIVRQALSIQSDKPERIPGELKFTLPEPVIQLLTIELTCELVMILFIDSKACPEI